MNCCYVDVALPPPIARELTYRLPVEMEIPTVGSLVLVPVSRRLVTGIVVCLKTVLDVEVDDAKIRNVEQILDTEILDTEVVGLCTWLADYYMISLGSALMAALPPGVTLTSKRVVSLTKDPNTLSGNLKEKSNLYGDKGRSILAELVRDGDLKVSTLKRRVGNRGLEASLGFLKRRGLISIAPILEDNRTRVRTELLFKLVNQEKAEEVLKELSPRAYRQHECIRYFMNSIEVTSSKLTERGFSLGVVKSLEQKGLIQRSLREVRRDPLSHIEDSEVQDIRLTPDQRVVFDSLVKVINAGKFHPALLHGVTGSGKTLVYINLVREVIKNGRSAIVLVPEIALAWQMVRRFKQYFGNSTTVLHSQLSVGERYDTWKRLRRGETGIVIGARSSIFAPLPNLGLIVVDEEHDTSYKQEDLEGVSAVSYNARDVALIRGKSLDALVVLGSATPSLESYYNMNLGKYHLYSLPTRIDNRPLPTVQIVDMKREPFQRKQPAIFSKTLRLKIHNCLERRQQVVLLQNRRGFAPNICCNSCGESVQCEACHISLTYHRNKNNAVMRCHYCDFSSPIPSLCPSCGAAELRFEGIGTQKVEKALVEQFPDVRVIRMDVDTTGWKGAHDELVERFRRREADVLLGTQMVAKGLDFPGVTLVGVISADTGMHMPDFRAGERSFQLLTQVAGRSGRGNERGEVVVQTRLPEDIILQTAASQDYTAFVEHELIDREEAGFPPYGRIMILRWQGSKEDQVELAARRSIAELMKCIDPEVVILGPSPAPLTRLRGAFRWQALLRGETAAQLRALVRRNWTEMSKFSMRNDALLTVNVDPLTIM